MPTISIIIPLYNGEKYIADYLRKLLKLGLSHTEVIIVDDGSSDNSYQICKQVVAGYACVRIVRQINAGLSVARNTGLELASGDYIVFLDSDDELLPNGFSDLQAFLMCYEPDVLMCKFVLIYPSGRRKYPTYNFVNGLSANEAKRWIYRSCPDSIWNAWRYVCRRSFLLKNELLFVQGLLHEDVDWTPRVLEAAPNIHFLNTPLYGYSYRRKGSIMDVINVQRLYDLNRTVLQGMECYKGRTYSKYLETRLKKESFFSIAGYCMIQSSIRCELRQLYRRIWGRIPLYPLSLSLFAAKLARNALLKYL